MHANTSQVGGSGVAKVLVRPRYCNVRHDQQPHLTRLCRICGTTLLVTYHQGGSSE